MTVVDVQSLKDEIDLLQEENDRLMGTIHRRQEQLQDQGDEIHRLRKHNEQLGEAVDHLISSVDSLTTALRTFL